MYSQPYPPLVPDVVIGEPLTTLGQADVHSVSMERHGGIEILSAPIGRWLLLCSFLAAAAVPAHVPAPPGPYLALVWENILEASAAQLRGWTALSILLPGYSTIVRSDSCAW